MLNISNKFKQHISKDNTNLFPLVIIDPDNNPIRLSTNSITSDDEFYAPLILNVNALRESINIKKYNHKINKVSVYITDRKYDNKKFSDTVENISISFQSFMINR